jgi:hypothetical protein
MPKATTEKSKPADAHREGRSATASLPEMKPVKFTPEPRRRTLDARGEQLAADAGCALSIESEVERAVGFRG